MVLIGIIALAAVLVNVTAVQTFLAHKAAGILSDKLKTKVTVRHVRIDLLDHLIIQGLYIEDRQGDTLLYSGEAEVRLTDWFFVKKEKPVITYLGLHDAYAHLERKASSAIWNYQFVIDAFNTGTKDTSKKQNEFEMDLKHLDLQKVRFRMWDAWGGENMDFVVGMATMEGKEIDLKKRVIDLNKIAITNTSIAMRSYTGGKPKSTIKKVDIIDTTAFNTGGWIVRIGSLDFDSCRYALTANEGLAPARLFDAEHMDIMSISVHARQLKITGDTLTAQLNHMSAKERCGLTLRELKGDVFVSPNESSVRNMLLRTTRSTVKNSYAMKYKRFPDFTDYIYKVRMEATLDESIIDPADIAYFAPVFTEYFPNLINGSGVFNGTVADFQMRNMRILEGRNAVSGNLAMTGLPDIDHTMIRFTDGTVVTTGDGIARFAPALRGNKGFDIASLSYVQYAGSYIGYIDNFAANGILRSNLGTIVANAKLNIPGFDTRKASYSGTIATQEFAIGKLLNNPNIGTLTTRADISGNSFDPEMAAVKMNAFIPSFRLYGYNYKKITADGILSRKKFDGKILVDDTALALSFNGSADFSGPQPIINAKAYLLKSDLQKIGLTTEPLEASADFDLNTTGQSIDDFTGFAKLYNINLRRRGHRLNLDSVYAISLNDGRGNRTLSIESNAATATIRGKYLLSKLGPSTQYFLAQYLPSYINNPKQYAPDQDFVFDVRTKDVDSLLAVLAPNIRGFDNSSFTGSLNTTAQKLDLIAKVPYGAVNKIKMSNVTLTGNGNFRHIVINGDVANIMVGDTIANLSLNLATTVGNDSVGFAITTSSPNAYGTASLNGSMVAYADSMYVSLLPSEFFLNGTRWEIARGSDIVFSRNFLSVHGLNLSAGIQSISAETDVNSIGQQLNVALKNIDLAQLGGLAGLADYQPDGRINGMVTLKNIFTNLQATADVQATDVKLGTDTIGTIKVAGMWDGGRKKIMLEPSSGIFRGDASLIATGAIVFDSTSNQQLDGLITLDKVPLTWSTPLVSSLVSKLHGTATGSVKIGGTGSSPDVDGNISLNDAGFRVDYIGTSYSIPSASFGISNSAVTFSSISIYDVLGNPATLSGSIAHNRFRNFKLGLSLKSDNFQVLNLQEYENSVFYGQMLAKTQFRITGPLDDLKMNIAAEPSGASHLYLPMSSSTGTGAYSYVTFKQYGTTETVENKNTSKLSLSINARMNPLAEITMIIDPTTGDQINAKGTGSLLMEIPAGGDLKLYGSYNIDEGDYTFTFRQLFFKRQFAINSGSNISFSGPISQTRLNVNGTYKTRASLYDLLTEKEIQGGFIPNNELADAKRLQEVNVTIFMTDRLQAMDLKFKLELPERRSVGTYAYTKFERINNSDRELFDQVASLLLIGYFIPPEGLTTSTVATGAISNMSQILSTTASGQLTNIVNKLLGDPNLQVEFKYKNYNISDGSTNNPLNRNEVKLGLRQNFLNDRLIVEVGGSYDWGRATAANSSSSNFNLLNDFRLQYLLSKDGRWRVNGFRTSDYDVLLGDNGQNITRSGMGMSWRKTFDTWAEFLHTPKYYNRRKLMEEGVKADSAVIKSSIGTE